MIPPAVERKVLTGAPGPDRDALVYEAIQGGLTVEPCAAGYRLGGPAETIEALGVSAAIRGDYFIETERPAANTIGLSGRLINARPYERVTTVQTDQPGIIARAVDNRLTVTAAGVGTFDVTGPSLVQMQWLADASGSTLEQTFATWGTNRLDIQGEDVASRAQFVATVYPVPLEAPAP